jgi:LCP family protein required for cell wall assembly
MAYSKSKAQQRKTGQEHRGSKSNSAGSDSSASYSRTNTKYQRASQKHGSSQGSLSRQKKIVIAVAGAIVVLLAGAGICVALFLGGINSALHPVDSEFFNLNDLNEALVTPEAGEPYYMLLVGSDSRGEGDHGRSDTLILCRIDPGEPQITLLSIPRDTEVYLDGYGTQKINAAYAYGGASGAVRAVSDLCGISIAHYAEIDFEGLIELVDILGGVTVKVPVEVNLWGTTLYPGSQVLDGEHALIFSRCRNYPMGDFQRAVNQRLLLQAIAKKVLAAGPLELPGLVTSLANCVSTDFSATGAIDLMMKMRGMDADDMYMSTIPSYSNFHDEVSYVAVDVDAFHRMIERVDAGLPPDDPDDDAGNSALNNVVVQ